MVPVVLFFQSTTRKSWRDKLAGVYRFAQEAGWQVQVVASGSSVADVRATLALYSRPPLPSFNERSTRSH